MSEPNPYEPPREPEPLTTGQIVKRSIGVGAILILTPVAVAIAGVTSCLAAPTVTHVFWLTQTITFLTALVVLAAMIGWAAWTHCQQTPAGKRGKRRLTLLLMTPVAVTAVGAVSLKAARLLANARWDLVPAIIVGFLIFLVPPGATLIGMLTAAWRADQDPGLDELPHEKRG